MASPLICFFLFFSFSTFYLFRERGKEGERRKHWCVVASHTSPAGDLACNPGVCPDWDSNQRPFGPQASTQSTEPHQPGHFFLFLSYTKMLHLKIFLTFLQTSQVIYSYFQFSSCKKIKQMPL